MSPLWNKTNVHEYLSPFSSDFPFLLGIVRSDWKIMVFNRSCFQSLRQNSSLEDTVCTALSVPVAISPFSWARHCDQVRIHHSGMTQWPLKGQNNRRFDQASAPGLDRSLSGCHQSPPKLTRIHIYEMPTNTKGRNGTRSRTAVLRRPMWSPKTAYKHDYLALWETSFLHWVRQACSGLCGLFTRLLMAEYLCLCLADAEFILVWFFFHFTPLNGGQH